MNQGKYLQVNGLNLYYEVHGEGQPLVLLHGGLGGIDMFPQLLPTLAASRQVIGVDLQGNGHTADIDRPFSFEQMADDVAALIEKLALAPSDVMGYSLGGGVTLQSAIHHPHLVRKLVLVSTPFKSAGWYPEVRVGMQSMNAEAAKMMVGSPMHQAYANAAPRPEDWPVLVTKTGKMVGAEYDWTEGVRQLKSPTLIVVGDADSVRPGHAVQFFELLGGGQKDAGWDGSGRPVSQLAILPGATHYDIFDSPLLALVVTQFLDAPMPEAK